MRVEADKEFITVLFKDVGYSVQEIKQPWRHIVGRLTKDDKDFFFKIASAKEISLRTRNEIAWNELINSDNLLTRVRVPKIITSGDWNGHVWYISDFIEGLPLANPGEPNNISLLEQRIDDIATTCIEILKLQTDKLLPREVIDKKIDIKKVFMNKISVWNKKITVIDTTPMMDFIESRLSYLKLSPQHGDFVPWHFLNDADQLYLIDGEASAIKGVKYYDAAYFYHRVYTKLKRPDIAGKFIHLFLQMTNFLESDKKLFELVLAQRVLGGFMDLQSDNVTSLDLQKELEDKLYTGQVFAKYE